MKIAMSLASSFKRSLTLVETLIALVLILAMGALIFPSLMDSLEEREFETAADVTNEQLMLARAHAQATGSPVEVTYSRAKSQVQARLFLPNVGALEDLSTAPPSLASKTAQRAEKNSRGRAIDESWALRALGRGLRLVSRQPAVGASTNDDIENEDDVETFENFGKGQEVRLAVFMPDGSALLNDEVWLNDEKGRVGVITINPWSGLPLFKRLTDLTAEAAGATRHHTPEPMAYDEKTAATP